MSDRTPPSNEGPSHRSTGPPPQRPVKPPPAEGTPEYDWLYGSRPSPGADDSTQAMGTNPDATRAMPLGPRSERRTYEPSGQGPTEPNQSPHRTPPPPPAPKADRRGRFPRPRPKLRWIAYLIVLWLVFLLATPIIAWNKVAKVEDTPDGSRPDDQPGTTYLLVGSDARNDDTTGSRTDSIMLLHTGSGPNVLMSIPRDSIVAIPGHDTTKINAAFAFGGAPLLIQTIEKNTGIRIDDYAEIGFTGFVDVVDAVGGIEVCPTEDMDDPKAHLKIKKGCQEVDGKTALAYSRSRHAQRLGDVDRAGNQRKVISAIGSKALSPWSFVNPVRYWSLNFAAARAITVGEHTGAISTARMFLAMTRVSGDKGLTCGVPISNLNVDWDPARSKQLFQKIIDDEADSIPKNLCTASGLPKSITG